MASQKNKTGKEVTCKTCKYVWLTRSKLFYVSCPRCHRQQNIRKVTKKTVDEVNRG